MKGIIVFFLCFSLFLNASQKNDLERTRNHLTMMRNGSWQDIVMFGSNLLLLKKLTGEYPLIIKRIADTLNQESALRHYRQNYGEIQSGIYLSFHVPCEGIVRKKDLSLDSLLPDASYTQVETSAEVNDSLLSLPASASAVALLIQLKNLMEEKFHNESAFQELCLLAESYIGHEDPVLNKISGFCLHYSKTHQLSRLNRERQEYDVKYVESNALLSLAVAGTMKIKFILPVLSDLLENKKRWEKGFILIKGPCFVVTPDAQKALDNYLTIFQEAALLEKEYEEFERLLIQKIKDFFPTEKRRLLRELRKADKSDEEKEGINVVILKIESFLQEVQAKSLPEKPRLLKNNFNVDDAVKSIDPHYFKRQKKQIAPCMPLSDNDSLLTCCIESDSSDSDDLETKKSCSSVVPVKKTHCSQKVSYPSAKEGWRYRDPSLMKIFRSKVIYDKRVERWFCDDSFRSSHTESELLYHSYPLIIGKIMRQEGLKGKRVSNSRPGEFDTTYQMACIIHSDRDPLHKYSALVIETEDDASICYHRGIIRQDANSMLRLFSSKVEPLISCGDEVFGGEKLPCRLAQNNRTGAILSSDPLCIRVQDRLNSVIIDLLRHTTSVPLCNRYIKDKKV